MPDKLIVANRGEIACRVLSAGLQALVIEGIETNQAFLEKVLTHPTFVAGRAHTTWISEVIGELI